MAATQVLYCGCTSVLEFKVKSAGDRSGARWAVPIPFHTRESGANFQDSQLGKGNRVHNIGGKGTAKTATCTVCDKKRNL